MVGFEVYCEECKQYSGRTNPLYPDHFNCKICGHLLGFINGETGLPCRWSEGRPMELVTLSFRKQE